MIPGRFNHIKEPSLSSGIEGSLTSVAVPVWLMSPVLLLILGDIVCTVTMVLLLLQFTLFMKAY